MTKKETADVSFIQAIYGDWLWKVTSLTDESEIEAELQIHEGRREVEDYKLCGLYDKPKGKSRIFEVIHKEIPGMRVHEEIVNAYYHTVSEALQGGGPIVMAGGHCTWAPGVAGALQEYLGEDTKIGIIWMDAHGDIKTEITSDNRLLAGMPLGTILGFGMEKWRAAACLKKPFDGKNVLISDYRVKTPEVQPHFKAAGIHTLDTEGYNNPEAWAKAVQEIADQVDAIYLHVDIDILRKEYIPTFGSMFYTPGGNEIDVVMDNIQTVMKTGKVYAYGVYNTMFDTDTPGQEMTTLTGMKLIGAGLEAWQYYPSK